MHLVIHSLNSAKETGCEFKCKHDLKHHSSFAICFFENTFHLSYSNSGIEYLPAFPKKVFKRSFIFHITVYASVIFLEKKNYPFALNIFEILK